MHQTIMLRSIRFIFHIFPVRLAHFLRSIEVGNTSQFCSGNRQTNGLDGPSAPRRFDHLVQGVLGFPKRPQFPEAEMYCCQNATAVAMVKVGGWPKDAIFTKNKRQSGSRWYSLSTRGLLAISKSKESLSHQLSKTSSVLTIAQASLWI